MRLELEDNNTVGCTGADGRAVRSGIDCLACTALEVDLELCSAR
jgi:hypothetical protein